MALLFLHQFLPTSRKLVTRGDLCCRTICILSHVSSNMNSGLFMDLELSYNYQFPSNYDSGSSTKSSNGEQTTSILAHDEIFNPTWESIFLQQNNNPSQISRKRSAEVLDHHTEQITNQGYTTLTSTNEEKQSRLRKQIPKSKKQKEGTVIRRSQKLTDKITALQKLVSPYGKTDTSSVLLEASISIKALQDQIKDLFDSESYVNMDGRKRYNLQSMGFCLVPLKISEKLVEKVSPNVCSFISETVTTWNL